MPTAEEEKCCCCKYCYHWEKDEEEAAMEHIQRSAQTSLCGILFCCNWEWLYNRHTVQKGYIILGILLCILPLWMLIHGKTVYEPAGYINAFKGTKCNVTNVEFNENITDSCVWENSEQETRGRRYFKCVQVTVSFQPTNKNHSQPRTFSTVIADGYHNLKKNFDVPVKCTTRPSSCSEYGDLEYESLELKRYFEDHIGDDLFECLYNPVDYQEVVMEGYHDLEAAVKHLIGVGVALAVTVVLLIFMCCTCGCVYIWRSKVPRSIHAAIEKEAASPATPLAPAAFAAQAVPAAPIANDITIHVDQPMRAVPAEQYMGGAVPGGAILLVPIDSSHPPNPAQGVMPMVEPPPPYTENPEPMKSQTMPSAPVAEEVKENPPC